MTKLKFQQFKTLSEQGSNVGMIIPDFMIAFQDTFYKSSYEEFFKFLKLHENVKKWIIFSDYVIGDKNKCQDVIAFCLMPYLFSLEKIQYIINNLQPVDLKKTKYIKDEFIAFMNNAPLLFITIILNKNRKLDFKNESYFFNLFIQAAINLLKHWCYTTPEKKEHYKLLIKDFQIIQQELSKRSLNKKLFRDIIIIANIVSYIMCEIVKLINGLEILGWFSDRDRILDLKKNKLKYPFITSLISNYFHIFCSKQSVNNTPKLAFGIPEEKGRVWYDGCNRLCDFICGTIADFDFENNTVSMKKFSDFLEKVIASNNKFLFFKIRIEATGSYANRLTIHKLTHMSRKKSSK